ncbi:DUF2252 family protein [Dongia sedimenti]|uniref:DUF2252 family protein n=1 Tax=Dongia sedimenti TaxID=3064282 RepID=A0ABU0YFV2_9PROT|nr:DUF2252 family protein [Rhodospirillaceae bacterium R-7]
MASRMVPGRSFKAENAAFEKWLGRQCDVVKKDLKKKHEKMRKDPFSFLRASYFRWARRIEAICPNLAKAPSVLSVGDVHLENFGTWRDAEGRWVWGVNDFDEAAAMPYPFDLVRLVASAHLAPGLTMNVDDIAAAVLTGYRRGLEQPRPTLLDAHETWMRPAVACSDAERRAFWAEIDALPIADPPRLVQRGLQRSLPAGARIVRFARRAKGGGGLGRPRFIADAVWCGGRVVREAKALVPSAWIWAHGDAKAKPQFAKLSDGAHRAPDPWLSERHGFVFRRIAADSRKVELDREGQARLTRRLLEAMGFDLGAIHAAAKKSRLGAIDAHLAAQPRGWLPAAALDAAADVVRDHEEWTR